MNEAVRAEHEEDDEQFRNERQGHFLNLRQRLQQSDRDPHHHGRAHHRARADDDHPDRGLREVENVAFGH